MTGTGMLTSGGVVTNSHRYAYNNANQRISQTRTTNDYVNYTYDPIGQLRSAKGYTPGGTPVADEQLGYRYDAAWNLQQRTNNGSVTTFQVNNLNQLTNNGGNYTYCAYDANGNLLNEGYAGYSPNLAFSYDYENQLVCLEYYANYGSTPVSKTFFTYDGFGRLRQREDYTWDTFYQQWYSSVSTRYLYDGRRVIQERNNEGRNVANTPTVAYTRGLDLSGTMEGAGGIGGLLARSHGYSSGNWNTNNFYHADGNGNVTFMLSSAQAMVAQYRYDAYGNLLSSAGSLASANVYRFSSKEFHSPSGLYYYGFRFYDPANQRWLNRDPLGEYDGINLYQVVRNNPINRIDPLGLWAYCQPSTWFNGQGYQPGPWEDLNGQAAQATLDGIIPFWDPFKDNGGYDPCDKALAISRKLGALARDAYLGTKIPNLLEWAKSPLRYEIGSTTVPTDVFEAMQGLSTIQRGDYLISAFGARGTIALNIEAAGGGAFGTTIWTGLTPGGYLLIGGADVAIQK